MAYPLTEQEAEYIVNKIEAFDEACDHKLIEMELAGDRTADQFYNDAWELFMWIRDVLNGANTIEEEQVDESDRGDYEMELARDRILDQQELEDFAQDGEFENMEASEIL